MPFDSFKSERNTNRCFDMLRHAEMLLAQYRNGNINHGEKCRFRRYPDWDEPMDDRCDTCKQTDKHLHEDEQPTDKCTPETADGAAWEAGGYPQQSENAELAILRARIEILVRALRSVIPYMEAAESAGIVGDEGCHWPVELVRAALAEIDAEIRL